MLRFCRLCHGWVRQKKQIVEKWTRWRAALTYTISRTVIDEGTRS